jgi:hypothetical protein
MRRSLVTVIILAALAITFNSNVFAQIGPALPASGSAKSSKPARMSSKELKELTTRIRNNVPAASPQEQARRDALTYRTAQGAGGTAAKALNETRSVASRTQTLETDINDPATGIKKMIADDRQNMVDHLQNYKNYKDAIRIELDDRVKLENEGARKIWGRIDSIGYGVIAAILLSILAVGAAFWRTRERRPAREEEDLREPEDIQDEARAGAGMGPGPIPRGGPGRQTQQQNFNPADTQGAGLGNTRIN